MSFNSEERLDHAGKLLNRADACLLQAIPACTRRPLQARYPDLPVEPARMANRDGIVGWLEDDSGVTARGKGIPLLRGLQLLPPSTLL